jgi:hypothetical protein
MIMVDSSVSQSSQLFALRSEAPCRYTWKGNDRYEEAAHMAVLLPAPRPYIEEIGED